MVEMVGEINSADQQPAGQQGGAVEGQQGGAVEGAAARLRGDKGLRDRKGGAENPSGAAPTCRRHVPTLH